ncbi:MAG: hypothetical protein H6807_13980 [Planctomycetes bacterium]|nr:hypothetical protein [Planctomycetota bacterium]
MAPDEALIALAAGEEAEQSEAQRVLFDEYFERLVAILIGACNLPEEAVYAGASAAFIEMFPQVTELVERGFDTPEQIWKWLVTRGKSRTIDELRKMARLRGLPEAQQAETAIVELEEGTTPVADDLSVVAEVAGRELTKSVLEFAESLDQPDRGILLGMLIAKDVVDQGQAAEVDSIIIDCLGPWGDYSIEALRARRKRIRAQLQQRFRELSP